MAFEKPKLFYNNTLRDAQEGNDGTAYATCATAVADPDDPNKVRGDIRTSADVADVSALEGSGIVFDATKNEYRITDSQALMRRLSGTAFLNSEAYPAAWLIDGSFLITVCGQFPGVITKYSLPDLSFVKQLTFNTAENAPTAIVKYGADYFVACRNDSFVAVLLQINAAELTRTSALTLNATELYPAALAIYGTDIFVACKDSSNTAILVRANGGLTRTSALVLTATSETYPTALVVYGTDIFVACRNGSNTATLVRTAGGIVRTSALVLTPTSEVYPTALAVYGTDIFVACRNGSNTATLVRCASGTSRTSALVLTPTSETYPTALVVYGTDIFVACYDGSFTATLVRTAGGLTRTSALVLTAASETYPAALVLYGADIFVACKDSDNVTTAVRTAGGLTRTSVQKFNAGEFYPTAAVLYGANIFIACRNIATTAVLLCVNNGLSRVSALTLTPASETYPTALAVYGTDIFVACRNASNTATLVRTAGGITRTSALVLTPTSETYPTALVVYGTDIFVACINAATTATLVRTAGGLTRTSALVLTPTSETYPTALVVYVTDIFVACMNAATTATLVRTAGGLTRTSALVLTAASEVQPSALVVYGTDIFVACRDGSNTATLVRTAAGLTRTSALVLTATSETYPTALVVYGTDIFVACRDGSNTATLVRTAGGLTRTSALVLTPVSETYPAALIIYLGRLVVLTGNVVPIGALVSVDPLPNFSLFSRLQLADVGGSFTVRAGLACAQADPARPVDYVADGHLSPRFKGTSNTTLYIRAHAPNFVTDGGFESGAFSPNWTAGANWAIDSATELEGQYSAKWDTAANNNLVQAITKEVVKGRTYRVCVKTKAVTGNAAANCLTITPKQAGSGTTLYAAITGNAIAPTTTSTWTEFDVVPDFTTDNWELWLVPLLANKGSATAIIVDEVYFYEKRTVNSLIVDQHNWAGHGPVVVKAWRVSPLRSTAASDANNYTQLASFTPDTAAVILQTLTSSVYPVYEITVPAASGWTADAGDIYLGDYWQPPKHPQPLDPDETGDGDLRELKLAYKNIPASYRRAQIEALFENLRQDEGVYVQWDADPPLLVEDTQKSKRAAYNPWTVDLELNLRERL
jgi:hypothetical protein